MSKQGVKWFLDVIMTVMMVLLMRVSFTGMLLHELMGLSVFVFFVLHNVLNGAFLRKVMTRLFGRGLPIKTRALCAMDILLFLNMTLMVGTGVLISRALFDFSGVIAQTHTLTALHRFTGVMGLILISLHLGLHWKSIMAAMHKLLRLKPSVVRTAVLRIAAAGMMLTGLYVFIARGTVSTIIMPFVQQPDSQTKRTETDHDASAGSVVYLSAEAAASAPTLEDYLSTLTCSGCGRRCLLTHPRCGRGETQAAQAETQYYTLYGEVEEQLPQETTVTEVLPEESQVPVETQEIQETQEAQGKRPSGGRQKNKGETQSGNFLTDTWVGYIPFMALFIGGAHYLIELPCDFADRRRSQRKSDKV